MIRSLLAAVGSPLAGAPPKNALQTPDWNPLPPPPCGAVEPTGGPCGVGAWNPNDGAGSYTWQYYDHAPVPLSTVSPLQPALPDATPFNLRMGLQSDPNWDPSVILTG